MSKGFWKQPYSNGTSAMSPFVFELFRIVIVKVIESHVRPVDNRPSAKPKLVAGFSVTKTIFDLAKASAGTGETLVPSLTSLIERATPR